MNIFFVDRDPRLAAEYLCDKHVVKMILESAQLLSTAHRILDGNEAPEQLYKIAHKNHPSNIWVRSGVDQYNWTFNNWCFMLQEYYYRYEKIHKSDRLREFLFLTPKNINYDSLWNDPPQCMPIQYKTNDVVEAYRNYYRGEKSKFAKWKKREIPKWFLLNNNNGDNRDLYISK